MKELTTEQKAQRYDEAVELAAKFRKEYLNYKELNVHKGVIEAFNSIFPELEESEDEKMIQYFKDLAPFDKADELYEKYGFSHKDAIAWLEKQGEAKPQGKSALEVKEVNLEKEIDKFYGMYRKDGVTFSLEDNEECVDWKVGCNPNFEKSFAQHFFELGMAVGNNAQKGK